MPNEPIRVRLLKEKPVRRRPDLKAGDRVLVLEMDDRGPAGTHRQHRGAVDRVKSVSPNQGRVALERDKEEWARNGDLRRARTPGEPPKRLLKLGPNAVAVLTRSAFVGGLEKVKGVTLDEELLDAIEEEIEPPVQP